MSMRIAEIEYIKARMYIEALEMQMIIRKRKAQLAAIIKSEYPKVIMKRKAK